MNRRLIITYIVFSILIDLGCRQKNPSPHRSDGRIDLWYNVPGDTSRIMYVNDKVSFTKSNHTYWLIGLGGASKRDSTFILQFTVNTLTHDTSFIISNDSFQIAQGAVPGKIDINLRNKGTDAVIGLLKYPYNTFEFWCTVYSNSIIHGSFQGQLYLPYFNHSAQLVGNFYSKLPQ